MRGSVADFTLTSTAMQGDPFGNLVIRDRLRVFGGSSDISRNGYFQAFENGLQWFFGLCTLFPNLDGVWRLSASSRRCGLARGEARRTFVKLERLVWSHDDLQNVMLC